ncbi:hypothetical protein CYMTET_27676 [Cymbomonas tetramitiformis]|uniref:Uncharacterized protein n=1 Tax=Cymbomonas tetramitiformis TaxID=36881 RepID=A0AAE0FPC5_9CHLO|nr:hypothetical protein CYMTET_27676 [Cymbomonas tetramitiformis]
MTEYDANCTPLDEHTCVFIAQQLLMSKPWAGLTSLRLHGSLVKMKPDQIALSLTYLGAALVENSALHVSLAPRFRPPLFCELLPLRPVAGLGSEGPRCIRRLAFLAVGVRGERGVPNSMHTRRVLDALFHIRGDCECLSRGVDPRRALFGRAPSRFCLGSSSVSLKPKLWVRAGWLELPSTTSAAGARTSHRERGCGAQELDLSKNNLKIASLGVFGRALFPGGAAACNQGLRYVKVAKKTLPLVRLRDPRQGPREDPGAPLKKEKDKEKDPDARLDLSSMNLQDEDAAVLAAALRLSQSINPKLKEINLIYNRITAEGVRELMVALPEFIDSLVGCHVTALRLSGNPVGDEGARHVLEALKGGCWRWLEVLEMYDTELTEGAENELKDAIAAINKTHGTYIEFLYDENDPGYLEKLDKLDIANLIANPELHDSPEAGKEPASGLDGKEAGGKEKAIGRMVPAILAVLRREQSSGKEAGGKEKAIERMVPAILAVLRREQSSVEEKVKTWLDLLHKLLNCCGGKPDERAHRMKICAYRNYALLKRLTLLLLNSETPQSLWGSLLYCRESAAQAHEGPLPQAQLEHEDAAQLTCRAMLRTVEALFLFIEMDADKVVGLLVKMKTHFWVMEFLLPAVFVDLGEEVCSSMKKLLLHLLHLRDRRVLRSFMSTLSRAAHEDEAHWIQLADKPKDSVGDSLFRRVVDLAVEPAVDQLSRAVAQLSPKLPRKTLLLFTKLLREMDLQISEMEELMHICVELVCARPFFTDGRDPGKWEKGAEIDPTCLAGLELLQTLLQYKKPGAEAGALVLLDSFLGLKFYNVCGMPLSHADSSSPDKYDALRLEASRLEASRLEDSRLKVSRLEVSRLEDSRLEASRLKVSRLEDSRLEALRLEASRLSFMISCCTALFRLLVLEKLSGASTAEPSCGAPPVDSPAQPVLGLLVARNLFGMTMRNFIYFKGVAGREKDNLEAEAACQANCKLAHLVKRVAPNFEEVVEQHSSELLMHDLLEYMDLVTERGKAGVRVPADLSNVEMVLDILSSLYRHAPERARYLTQNRLLARTLDVCEMITERAERAEAGEVTSYGMMGALEDMIVAWAAVPTSAPEAGRAPGETVLEEIGTNRVQCLRLLACLIRLQPFPESLTEPVNSLLASLKLKDAGEGFTHTCPLRLLKPCGFDDAYRDDPGVGLTINIADGALGWQNQSSKDKKEQEEWITYWQLARDICNYQLAALHVRTDHVCFSAADAKSLGFAVGRAAKRGRGPRDLHIRKRAETGSPKAAEGGRDTTQRIMLPRVRAEARAGTPDGPARSPRSPADLPGDVAEGEIKLEGEGFGWMEMMVLLGFMEVHTHFTSIDCSFILKDAEKEVEQGVVEEVIAMRNKCKGLRTVKLYDEELRLMDLTETVTALVTETSAAEEQVKGRSPEQVAVVRASFRQAEMALMTTAAASNAAFTTFLATNSDKVNGWSFDYIARMAKNAPSLAVLDLSGTGLYSSLFSVMVGVKRLRSANHP